MEEIKSWLLQTVWGIIVLGAIGSLVAMFAVYLARAAFRNAVVAYYFGQYYRLLLMLWLLYPFAKAIDRAKGIREAHGQISTDTKYLAFVVHEMAVLVGLIVMWFGSILAMLLIYLLFALERPLELALFVGSTMFFTIEFLKMAIYTNALVSPETQDTAVAVAKAQPKTFREWRERDKPPTKSE